MGEKPLSHVHPESIIKYVNELILYIMPGGTNIGVIMGYSDFLLEDTDEFLLFAEKEKNVVPL